MTTTEKHAAKKLSDGKREYRGVVMEKYPDTPPGYWGHWRSRNATVNGATTWPDLRSGSMKGLMNGIDQWLIDNAKRQQEATEKLAADEALLQKRMANTAAFNQAWVKQPPTPWHVERALGGHGSDHVVMQSPAYPEGSRMAIARGISMPHVAVMLAESPEMYKVLIYAHWVLESNRWNKQDHSTGGPVLFQQITELLDKIHTPFVDMVTP